MIVKHKFSMYSGLLPKDLNEDDLSPEEEENELEDNADQKVGKNESSVTARCTNVDVASTQNMPGISDEMWQKFQELRKKNEESRAVKIPPKRRRRKKGRGHEEPAETSEHLGDGEKHWSEFEQYFGVNDRFHPPACSKPPPKSGLEKSIEKAIAEGDVAKAEEMSDRLATREMAVKIAQAADCRNFVQKKQEEEALREAKRKKKEIAWGFEAKRRWETKSNMGYM